MTFHTQARAGGERTEHHIARSSVSEALEGTKLFGLKVYAWDVKGSGGQGVCSLQNFEFSL